METKQITQQAIAKIGGLPHTTAELSPTQHGWLKLEANKRQTFTELQKQELEVQAVLLNITDVAVLETVQKKIKEAKEIAATAKSQRLVFTGLIDDKLIKPSMEFEKRNDALIATAAGHEFTLRKAESTKAAEAGAYSTELANLKAHIQNEYHRIATVYRGKLNQIILDAYTTALRGKTPVDTIDAYKAEIKKMLGAEKLPDFIKFTRVLVKDPEAVAAFGTVPKYDATGDLNKSYEDLDSRFALYAQELQNAEAATQAAIDEAARVAAKAANDLDLEVSTNTLIAAAEASTVSGPVIKKTMEVIEENTQAWAMAVMANFIKNIQDTAPKLRVKTWAKLTIGQQAETLAKLVSETGLKFPGLNFKEVEK